MFKNYEINDLITSPFDPKVDHNIGALCFVGNTSIEALNSANSGIHPRYYFKGVNPNNSDSFIVRKKRYSNNPFKEEFVEDSFPFIILAKNTEHPFNDNLDFIEAYEKNSESLGTLYCHSLSQRGVWLLRKRKFIKDEDFELVTRISEKGVYINRKFYTWEDLFYRFSFLNGDICGVELQEEK